MKAKRTINRTPTPTATEGKRTQQEPKQTASQNRLERLTTEVNEIIDRRERALKIAEKIVNENPGTCIAEDRLVEMMEYHGIARLDAVIVVRYDGGRWRRLKMNDTDCALVVKA